MLTDLGDQEKTLRPGPYPESRHGCVERTLHNALLFVLMEINDLPRLIQFYGYWSPGGNIPEHAAFRFEFKVLLTS